MQMKNKIFRDLFRKVHCRTISRFPVCQNHHFVAYMNGPSKIDLLILTITEDLVSTCEMLQLCGFFRRTQWPNGSKSHLVHVPQVSILDTAL